MSLIKKMQVAPLSLNIRVPWASCKETRAEFLQQTQPRAAPGSPRLLWGQTWSQSPVDRSPVPLWPFEIYFFARKVFYFNKTEKKRMEAFTALPVGMKSFSLVHNYQMAKQIPRGRWILGLIFLLHMFDKVNKECEEIYVTQRRFSQHTKNSGMNLIAVPEERGDVTGKKFIILHNIHFIHLIINVRQWQLFSSKLKMLQQHSLGWNSHPVERMG